jgi:hypothetical protein
MHKAVQRFNTAMVFSIALQSCYTPLKRGNKKLSSSPIVHFNKLDNSSIRNSSNYVETKQSDTAWLQVADQELIYPSNPTSHVSSKLCNSTKSRSPILPKRRHLECKYN